MTKKVAVIGSPVKHSLSPAMHNAAYKYLGIDWEYVTYEIDSKEISDVVNKIRSLFNDDNFSGLNITMPHKEAAFNASDKAHGAAQRLGTVNTMIVDETGMLHGYSTDGDGFIYGLKSNNVKIQGCKFLVIGAGSAAKAICDSLYMQGAHVFVTARNRDQSNELCDLVSKVPSPNKGDITSVDFSLRRDYVSDCYAIVNATPIGMAGIEHSQELPIDTDAINSSHVVIDTIYYPAQTVFLREAKEKGAQTLNGIPMLLGQGALAFELMTGCEAPVDVMGDALEQELKKKVTMGSLTDEQVLNLAIMFSVLFGAIIGSFLNVVIYRLPKKQSIAKERSHCPNCKKQIENLDNIPVLSYIALRGKCRNCKTRISFRYPLVEILTAAIWGVTVWRVGIHLYTIGYLIFFSGLIALSFIDFEHMLLPKKIIYATGGALIAFLVFSSVINEELNRVRDAAIVGVAYFAFFLLMWLATQQKAMGFGDVRLSFFLGLSMGYFGFVVSYAGLLLSFLLGSVIGIVFVAVTGKGRKAKIPFGPFLALGTIIVIWCAPAISDLVQLNHV